MSILLLGDLQSSTDNGENNNIRLICDICNSNGSFITKEDLQNMFNFVVDQMEYNSLVSAIPDRWRQMIIDT